MNCLRCRLCAASGSEFSLHGTPLFSIKLTSRNFLFWRTQLVPFLRGQNLLGFVDGSLPCSPSTIPASSDGASGSVANPSYGVWIQQDQAILSMIISSLSEEVMHLAVGRGTSKAVWNSIERALASSSRARALNLLSQLQGLRQGSATVTEYLGKAQVLIEELTLAGRSVSPDEQNLYAFHGLRQEFRSLVSSLSTRGTPVTLQELSDFLAAQEFICHDAGCLCCSSRWPFLAGRGRRTKSIQSWPGSVAVAWEKPWRWSAWRRTAVASSVPDL